MLRRPDKDPDFVGSYWNGKLTADGRMWWRIYHPAIPRVPSRAVTIFPLWDTGVRVVPGLFQAGLKPVNVANGSES